MKIIITVLLLLSASLAIAMGPVGGSGYGADASRFQFQKRDVKSLNLGLQAYQKGADKRALKHFKRAAKLGNNKARYLAALIYLDRKDYVTSYAWLQLLEEPVDQSTILLDKFANLLTEQEQLSAVAQLSELKVKYLPKSSRNSVQPKQASIAK